MQYLKYISTKNEIKLKTSTNRLLKMSAKKKKMGLKLCLLCKICVLIIVHIYTEFYAFCTLLYLLKQAGIKTTPPAAVEGEK